MRKLFVFVLIFSNFLAQSQTKKVLFIGNSYTLRNNMPQITANIASSRGDELVFSNSSIESYSLKQHSSNTNTLNSIRQGGWDYVVLQEFSQYPSEPLSWVETNVYPYARYLDSEINSYNSGAETIFYMTWGRRDGDADRCLRLPAVCTYIGMDDLTRERYMYMAQNNQAVVSPVGAVWRYIRENYPSIELYESDGSHPSPAGSYAAACCFYTAIFREDPGQITYNFTLSQTDASNIRTATKMVVYNNLGTWYLGESNKFTITSSSGTGGSISPSGLITVNQGDSRTFTFTSNTGYYISDIRVDNESAGAITSYTFENVTASHTISASFSPVTYTISGSAGTGGSISPAGNVTVNHGSGRTFAVIPGYGFQVADVKVDNHSVGAVTTYTFSNVTEDHTISASFETATYSLTASAGNGGSINPAGNTTVTHGTNHTYTITPSTGYRISDVRADNSSVGAVSSYTFSNITNDHSISAAFEILTYTITSSTGTGGSVSSSGNITVDYGSSRTFTFTANTGYYLSDVLVDNVSAGQPASYTFRDITDDHSISAVFRLITFTLTGSAGDGGSISPSGESTADYGSRFTYTITPDEGFLISDVKIDNLSAGKISSHTFSNITSSHNISASFIPITFNIKGSSSAGGSISPSGIITVTYGTDLTYTITPETGYQVNDVFIDDKPIGPVSGYTFSSVKGDHFISVVFSVITYSVIVEANSGGSVTPEGTTIVNYGSKITCTFTPEYGYRIKDVIVDGTSAGTFASYSFNSITDNHNLKVIFEPIPKFIISSSPGTGGSITPSGSVTHFEGTDQVYSIIPEEGYRIMDVMVDNKSVGPVSEYIFTSISSNHTISASFTTSIEVSVYPNPFVSEFKIFIATPEGKHFDMTITDLNGKIVSNQNEIPGNIIIPVSLQISRGYYILRILSEGKKIATIKIVKS